MTDAVGKNSQFSIDYSHLRLRAQQSINTKYLCHLRAFDIAPAGLAGHGQLNDDNGGRIPDAEKSRRPKANFRAAKSFSI
jgi:hypothetical protein